MSEIIFDVIILAASLAVLVKSAIFAIERIVKFSRITGKLVIKSARPKVIKDQDMILLDDMVSSGDSIVKAIQFLKRKNYGKIYVAFTHAVLSGNAERKLKKAGVFKIISTNTVSKKTNKVDVSGIIAEAIKNW